MNKHSLYKKDDCEGFSLLELVTVVSVLGILSAITIPKFTCFVKESEVQAAVTTLLQTRKECIHKKYTGGPLNLGRINASGYILETNYQQPCEGINGRIRLIPAANSNYPQLFIETGSMRAGYLYEGYTGHDMGNCKNMVCGDLGQIVERRLAESIHVIDSAYKRRGCSLYAIVKGNTWEIAEAQANQLGGNLVTINTKDEYKWIQENITDNNQMLLNAGYPVTPAGERHTSYFVGLNDKNSEGRYQWSSGQGSEWSNNEDLIHRQNWIAQKHLHGSHDYFVMNSNDRGFTGKEYINHEYRPDLYNGDGVGNLVMSDDNGTFYKTWGVEHLGIAEIPACKS